MILYVNGDSNSAAAEIKDSSLSWPCVLKNRLGVDLLNHSVSAASNQRIYRTTKEFISNNYDNISNYFVVIGWSSWEREEWQHEDAYYQVTASGRNSVPEELRSRYTQWVLDQNEDEFAKKSAYWHDQIYQLHLELLTLSVKHYFFNAVMDFYYCENPHDWTNHYFDPYNDSYYWYLKKQGFVPTANQHHLEPAQQHWATVLEKQIKELL